MTNDYRTGRPSLTKAAVEADRRKYLTAKAQKESALANLAELEWQRKSMLYVARAAVIQGNAAALGVIHQHLSAIPAEASRRLSLRPEIVTEMQHLIAEALEGLATEMQKFSQQ